jgi:O-methyltransferase
MSETTNHWWAAKDFNMHWMGDWINEWIAGDAGHDYGITPQDKQALVDKIGTNPVEGSRAREHIVLVREILAIPSSLPGNVIECGVWKGASSCSLSLVCEMVGRKLLVCDSFRGLPEDGMKLHKAPHFGHAGCYKEGMFCGRFDEVRENIEKYGSINSCHFIPGWFSQSLKILSEPIVFAFLDVDLVSSTQDCLRYIWPLLPDGCLIFTDDAGDVDIDSIWFDYAWWFREFLCPPPGFVGSGCGLPITGNGS